MAVRGRKILRIVLEICKLFAKALVENRFGGL